MKITTEIKVKTLAQEPSVGRLKEAVDKLWIRLLLDISGPSDYSVVRSATAEISKAYAEARSLFENNSTLRGQVEGDAFALWYLEGI